MPTKECIWLNDVKSLLPKLGKVGEQNEPETIVIGNLRSLYLSVEYNQLLTKQRIFNNQIGATTVRSDKMPEINVREAGLAHCLISCRIQKTKDFQTEVLKIMLFLVC